MQVSFVEHSLFDRSLLQKRPMFSGSLLIVATSNGKGQYSVLQCVAVCCSVLQYVTVCCSVLHCVAVWKRTIQLTFEMLERLTSRNQRSSSLIPFYTFFIPLDSQIKIGETLFCLHMGWLWLAGSIKLLVSFAKEPYKRDDTLQKRPIF